MKSMCEIYEKDSCSLLGAPLMAQKLHLRLIHIDVWQK